MSSGDSELRGAVIFRVKAYDVAVSFGSLLVTFCRTSYRGEGVFPPLERPPVLPSAASKYPDIFSIPGSGVEAVLRAERGAITPWTARKSWGPLQEKLPKDEATMSSDNEVDETAL